MSFFGATPELPPDEHVLPPISESRVQLDGAAIALASERCEPLFPPGE